LQKSEPYVAAFVDIDAPKTLNYKKLV